MVRVIAHQRRQIKSCRESCLALGEEIAEAGVGVFRGAEAGKLAHGPKARAVHRGMDSARIWGNAWQAQIALRIPVRQVRIGVEPPNRMPGCGREIGRSFGAFFQSSLKSVLLPGEFFGRRPATW